jgi:flagellar motor switch protein FliN/FliY
VEIGSKISDPAQAASQAGSGINDQATEAAGAGAAETPAAANQEPAAPQSAPASALPRPPAGGTTAAATAEDLGLEILLDIPMELTVELGRTKIPIRELLRLSPGAAVKLAKFEGEPVDILANDVLIARGEVVVRNEKYGIRITEITNRMERLKGLR